ncbi:zinc-binding dehydrogenase [Microbispora sp. GKU 823]|uniref:zinc-binding dehydrogenase n=1 Tax=Microbispora sp. GKU 823 TaxID=1652100 RepID=UPI0021189A4E|nr:zinc-binding dehydrogenase [Microbispora sp. GKU 823]
MRPRRRAGPGGPGHRAARPRHRPGRRGDPGGLLDRLSRARPAGRAARGRDARRPRRRRRGRLRRRGRGKPARRPGDRGRLHAGAGGAARRYGAHETFSYGDPADAKARIKELTGGAGADVVFDPVGGPVAEAAVRAVAWGGRYLVIGFASGGIPRVGLNIPLVKGSSVVGVFWGEFVRRERAVHERNLRQIFDWAAAGRLRHRVHDVLPLGQGPRALRELADGRVRGKLLLRAGGPAA